LLDEVRPLIEERVEEPVAPSWAIGRGWVPFLSAIGDDVLATAEREGLAAIAETLPSSLATLARRIADATRIDSLPTPAAKASFEMPRASDRKRGQVAAIAAQCEALGVRPSRVIDVGAGRGHLTRELALLFDVPVVGLERNADRVAAAKKLGHGDFRVEDVRSIALEPDDLAVGLHACGELADAIVASAAEHRAHAVVVSCCFQKVRGDVREPISPAGHAAGVRYAREALGLANLAPGEPPVEASVHRSLEGRRTRRALRILLEGRGLVLERAEESRGINRRRMLAGLEAVAAKAFALRALTPPTAAEIAAADARSAREFAVMRRFNLPRVMVGRVLELAIVLDRAARLEEAGHRVEVSRMFESRLSPRNLGIAARGRPR
jgi:SAM-dependent methyltransferase